MAGIIRSLLAFLYGTDVEELSDKTEQNSSSVVEVGSQAYKLFDCVMFEDRYEELQYKIREADNPNFDPFLDLGVVLGSSSNIDPTTGIPDYYVIGWFNNRQPERPILKKVDHFELTPVIRPMGDLAERSEYLNKMFNAFYLNWLDVFDHERATKN